MWRRLQWLRVCQYLWMVSGSKPIKSCAFFFFSSKNKFSIGISTNLVFFSLNQNGERERKLELERERERERERSVIRNPHWERTSDTLEKVKKRDRWMESQREREWRQDFFPSWVLTFNFELLTNYAAGERLDKSFLITGTRCCATIFNFPFSFSPKKKLCRKKVQN